MSNQKTSYQVVLTLDYATNEGNPEHHDTIDCVALKEAETCFAMKSNHSCVVNGKTCTVSLWELDEDGNRIGEEPIKEAIQESEMLPEGAVIVTYNHVKHIGYAYEITDIRFSEPLERKDDLFPDKDTVQSPLSEVYDSLAALKLCYEEKFYIMDKLHSGSDLVEAFLAENGIEPYASATEEDTDSE